MKSGSLSWPCGVTPEYHAAALQFVGAAEDDLYRQWLPLLSYALDCADEARLLMHKLDLALGGVPVTPQNCCLWSRSFKPMSCNEGTRDTR